VGYNSDTISVNQNADNLEIVLQSVINLDEIQVLEKRIPFSISTVDPLNSEHITSDGLQQLACCSLAESFESTATVDVGYTDAVSGAKQIQMLGLAGVYSQMLLENQPAIRILSSTYGLNYIPGPWMSAIRISKGTASVINGYESITGQINIDLKKPENSEKLYAELFINEHQRLEVNTTTAFKINDKLSSIFLIHGSGLKNKVDNNDDGFLDLPTANLLIASNRYHFNHKGKIKSRFGFEIMTEDRVGGQTDFKPNSKENTPLYYGIEVQSNRFNIYENIGFLIDEDHRGSLALNGSFIYHRSNSTFGLRKYDAEQRSLNLKLRYQTEFINEKHKLDAGLDFISDNFAQTFNDTAIYRDEMVPGIFSEYTYSNNGLSIIGGLRYDFNNLFGNYLTPRIHIKYGLTDNSTIRVSAGKGYRTANVFPENIGLLASSRQFVFMEEFKQEEAWNYGISYVQKWFFDDDRKMTFSIDFYRTDFQNQIVVDINQSAGLVYFYNLNGDSYSNSFQTNLMVTPAKRFDITLAYRYNDVKITMDNELIRKPLSSPHKALVSLHYSTKFEKWNFTLTTHLNGKSNLPYTGDNPTAYQLEDESPAYLILHTQILRKFSKWEIYLGAENLTNYKQQNPILAADDPFGDYFDSSIVWGPVIGRSINAGVRLKIN
jgi:outer membrane receptor for ferrienterochelin and colicin